MVLSKRKMIEEAERKVQIFEEKEKGRRFGRHGNGGRSVGIRGKAAVGARGHQEEKATNKTSSS